VKKQEGSVRCHKALSLFLLIDEPSEKYFQVIVLFGTQIG
jgi:hypothetical protein